MVQRSGLDTCGYLAWSARRTCKFHRDGTVFGVSFPICMFQDSVPAGSYNDPFLSSVCVCVCVRGCVCVCVCVTKLCVKDGVSKMVCDKVVCEKGCAERWCVEDGVWKMVHDKVVCDKVVCERWCVKDGVWQSQSCVWKMVCDKVVCDKVVCERWCVTKLGVKHDKRWCVTKMVCKRRYVEDGVWQSGVWKMVCDKVLCESAMSATPTTQNDSRCEFVPRLPRKVPRRHGRPSPSKRARQCHLSHAWHAKRQ